MPNELNEEEDLIGDEVAEITSMVDEEGEHLAMHRGGRNLEDLPSNGRTCVRTTGRVK